MTRSLTLIIEDEVVAVCRLSGREAIPEWALVGGFCSITRTADELSIVCPDDRRIPAEIKCEHDWRLLRVAGTQDFNETGILSSILEPLAKAEIGIFAVSTFDTDYVMVKSEFFDTAVKSLRAAGHTVQ